MFVVRLEAFRLRNGIDGILTQYLRQEKVIVLT